MAAQLTPAQLALDVRMPRSDLPLSHQFFLVLPLQRCREHRSMHVGDVSSGRLVVSRTCGAAAAALVAGSYARCQLRSRRRRCKIWSLRVRPSVQQFTRLQAVSSSSDQASSLEEEADDMWRRAYETERERSLLLQMEAEELHLPRGVAVASQPDVCKLTYAADVPVGGWRSAFEALKAENDSVQKSRADALRVKSKPAAQESGVDSVHCGTPSAAMDVASVGAVDAASSSSSSSAKATIAAASDELDAGSRAHVDSSVLNSEGLQSSTSTPTSQGGRTEETSQARDKVYSFFSLPDTDSIDDDLATSALQVTMDTDLPALAALFGVAASEEQVPSLPRVRDALGIDSDEEIKGMFRVDTVEDYGGRAFELRGSILPPRGSVPSANAPVDGTGLLLSKLQARLDRRLSVQMDVFAQPASQDTGVRVFIFARGDLPMGEVSSESQQFKNAFAASVFILCNLDCVTAFLISKDLFLAADDVSDSLLGVDVASIWPEGPLFLLALAVGLAARQGAADIYGLPKLYQCPLPSLSVGHMGSVWVSSRGFLPSQCASFDIAAAGPAAMLCVSLVDVAFGAWQVKGLDATEAPFRVPAIDLPASLAAALGYAIPALQQASDGLPLLGLNTPLTGLDAATGVAAAIPLVPMNVFLLSGAGGLAAAAVNLLPLSGFDGHLLARAAFGGSAASVLELLSLWGLLSEVGRTDARGTFASEVLLLWSLQWIVGNRRDEAMPPKDSVTPVGYERQAIAVMLLSTSVLILAPPL